MMWIIGPVDETGITEEKNIGNAWKTNSKPVLATSSRRNYSRENSDVSQSHDEYHVRMTNSHDNWKYRQLNAPKFSDSTECETP